MALAVDFVEAAIKRTYDSLILFSCDTDLLPALELVDRFHTTHVEIACWTGGNPLFLRAGLRESRLVASRTVTSCPKTTSTRPGRRRR